MRIRRRMDVVHRIILLLWMSVRCTGDPEPGSLHKGAEPNDQAAEDTVPRIFMGPPSSLPAGIRPDESSRSRLPVHMAYPKAMPSRFPPREHRGALPVRTVGPGHSNQNPPQPKVLPQNPDGADRYLDTGQKSSSSPAPSTTKPPIKLLPSPRVHSRPNPKMKSDVQYRADKPDFIMKLSADQSAPVRFAPTPLSGSPWPKPQSYKTLQSVLLVERWNFTFEVLGKSCDILTKALERTRRNLFGVYNKGFTKETFRLRNDVEIGTRYVQLNDSDVKTIHQLFVTVMRDCKQYPSLDMDESYELVAKHTGVYILAKEVWGALRGLDTFTQLVFEDVKGRLLIHRTSIEDFPRFPHRGILLDTSRHFLDKETIIANLEAMALNKMNVLHWHIVDEQSFPFQSHKYPDLTKYGAYDPVTHIYTHEDIREIIEEARIRGIRVVPEFDTPGHTMSWGFGMPDLLTPCYSRFSSKKSVPTGGYGPINPILNSTYVFLKGLLTEVLDLFPDKYVHLGGDEVPFHCWMSNPDVLNFSKEMGFGADHHGLLNYYETQLLDIVDNIGKSRAQRSGAIVWQEVSDNHVKLKNDTIVQVWLGHIDSIPHYTSRGQKVIISTCWYFDHVKYGAEWGSNYLCQTGTSDLTKIGDKVEEDLLGGEACLWMEYADDANALSRLWPRASATAERLWSSKLENSVMAAGVRIEEQRCRMKRLGLPVGVLSGPGHCAKTLAEQREAEMKKMGSQNDNMNMDDILNSLFAESLNIEGAVNKMTDIRLALVVLCILVFIGCLMMTSHLKKHSIKSNSVIIQVLTAAQPRRVRPKTVMLVFISLALLWSLWLFPYWTTKAKSYVPSTLTDSTPYIRYHSDNISHTLPRSSSSDVDT